jgi:hypothetical protein
VEAVKRIGFKIKFLCKSSVYLEQRALELHHWQQFSVCFREHKTKVVVLDKQVKYFLVKGLDVSRYHGDIIKFIFAVEEAVLQGK